MTDKEAVSKLSEYSSTNGSGRCTDDEHNEAKRLGIQALEEKIEREGMYHTCRWCKHYDSGLCYLGMLYPVIENRTAVYGVAEDGGLSGVIEETLNSNKPETILKELDKLLAGWKVSKAKRGEVKKLFDEMIPEFLDFTLKEKLDEVISRLYQERLDNEADTEVVEIKDPESFYCSRWE